MDDIIENIMRILETSLKKEGKSIDPTRRNMIKESLKNQLSNLSPDKRNEIIGLISTHIKM